MLYKEIIGSLVPKVSELKLLVVCDRKKKRKVMEKRRRGRRLASSSHTSSSLYTCIANVVVETTCGIRAAWEHQEIKR